MRRFDFVLLKYIFALLLGTFCPICVPSPVLAADLSPRCDVRTDNYNPILAVSLSRIETDDKQTITRSPNGELLNLVTSCGDLEHKAVRYTFWIFKNSDINNGLSDGQKKISPSLILTHESRNPRKGLRRIKWLPDSSGFMFLLETGPVSGEIDYLDLQSGKITTLVIGERISDFQPTNSGIVYLTYNSSQDPILPPPSGYLRWKDSILTTFGLATNGQPVRGKVDLWSKSYDDAAPHKVFTTRDQVGLLFPPLAISPDGRYAVLPQYGAHPSFKEYRAPYKVFQAELDKATSVLQLHIIDLTTGRMRPVINAPFGRYFTGRFSYDQAVWAPDSKSFVVKSSGLPIDGASREQREERRSRGYVLEFEVPSLRYHVISPLPIYKAEYPNPNEEMRAKDIRVSADARFVTIERQTPSGPLPSVTFEKANGRWSPAKESQPSFSVEVTQSFDTPPVIVAKNSKTSAELVDLNPVLRTFDVGHVELFKWQDKRGRSHTGGLVIPPGNPGKPLPLVMQYYGFEPSEYLADGPLSTAFAARSLASRGFLVLQLPYAAKGERFNSPDEGPSYLDMVLSAIDALVKAGRADGNRVGLVGFSHSCYWLRYAIANAPDRFAAAVAADGLSMGFFPYLLGARLGGSDAQENYYLEFFGTTPFTEAGLQTWRRLSPFLKSADVKAALLSQAIGTPGSALGSWEMHQALRSSHVPAEMLWIGDGDHELFLPQHRLMSMQATVDWMRFWLKNEEPVDTVPRETLEHWKSMRSEQQLHRVRTSESRP